MKPDADRVGESGTWELEDPEGLIEVTGSLVGFVSTRESKHSHFSRWAPRGEKCRACRWFQILVIQTDSKWVMHRIGPSQVPHETPMFTPLTVTDTAAELVEQAHHWSDRTGAKFLSSPAREVLEVAAEFDDEMHEALVALRSEQRQVVRRIG
jgi:hypothetical protein